MELLNCLFTLVALKKPTMDIKKALYYLAGGVLVMKKSRKNPREGQLAT